ncbi:MAG TPA: hypothetical protein VLW52_07060 [Opitutaceae bacterium]|nr:hypothetical protein [Opitutaceae bacterium]
MNPTATGFAAAAPPGPRFFWTLRVGAAACFIGHGALGLNQTSAWAPYFAVAGIHARHALALMPWVGAFDGAMALSVLFRPVRAVVAYMFLWTVWTALLRPLAGESAWEAVERAGNFGVPLALVLCLHGGRLQAWLGAAFPDRLEGPRRRAAAWILRLTTVLLLLGHGMLQLAVRKPMFCAQYAMFGLPGAAAEPYFGGLEIALALGVLLKPSRGLLFGVFGWKLATEALCPLAGLPLWVFIEHGGSYAAPLALAFLTPALRPSLSAPKSQLQATPS